eukprot:1577750-Rhodomonas_salina.1
MVRTQLSPDVCEAKQSVAQIQERRGKAAQVSRVDGWMCCEHHTAVINKWTNPTHVSDSGHVPLLNVAVELGICEHSTHVVTIIITLNSVERGEPPRYVPASSLHVSVTGGLGLGADPWPYLAVSSLHPERPREGQGGREGQTGAPRRCLCMS